jgi:S1-C subfamily serine protease
LTSGSGRQIGVGGVLDLTSNTPFWRGDGLLIEKLENSPAEKRGSGDIIVEANSKTVKGQIDLVRGQQ